MSGNPNPSPATRFKPGSEWRGNAKGPKTGNPHKSTILRASRQVRPLDEVLADANNWRGTHSELLESVMRDEQHPIDTRLACANSLMRAGIGGDKPKSSADMKRLTTMERELFLALAYKLTDGAQAWKIDDYPMPEPRRSQEVQDILDYIAADGVEPDDDTATESDKPEPPPPPKSKSAVTTKSASKRFDQASVAKPKANGRTGGVVAPATPSGLAGLPALPPPTDSPSRGLAVEGNCPPVNQQRPQRDAKCWVCGSPRFWRLAVSAPGEPWRCKQCHPPGNVNFVECNTHADRTIR